VKAKESENSIEVLVKYQVFAEQPHRFGRFVFQLGQSCHRQPIPAQKLAHRRAATYLRQTLVFLLCEHS
jgi:hypothetical protein